ncbi:MAG: hypothetical protein QNJ47_08470 [Nostocaceae cyanobacterium]|nr:hypothetical protein [Nostocaceae cyanobacterium]
MKGKFIALLVTGLTVAFTSNIAFAESGKAQTKMRSDVLKILCERFPYNSRCTDNGETKPTMLEDTTAPETNSVETETPQNTSEPMNEETTVPTTPETQTIPVVPGENPTNMETSPAPVDNPTNMESQPTVPDAEMTPQTDDTINDSSNNMELETPENTDEINTDN